MAWLAVLCFNLSLALSIATRSLPARSHTVLPPRGSVVLVTGAKSGLGLASAASLAEQGYTVWAGMRPSHLNRSIP